MYTRSMVALTLGACLSVAGLAQAGTPLGTAFTYRGRLQQNGSPVDGTVNMAIGLWDAATDGNPIGSIADPAPVQVTNGLFVITLDYGNVFNGDARWLEVNVNGTTLSPRQPISGVPYALHTRGLSVDDVGEVGLGADAITDNRLFLLGTGSMNTLTLKSDRGPNYSHVHAFATGDWYIRSADSAGTVYIQDSGGHVAVGSVSPTAKLHSAAEPGETAIKGESSANGTAIEGISSGLFGQGIGVHGVAQRTGLAASGRGVVGESTDSAGVEGDSYAGPGVFGKSDSDIGVKGESSGSGTGIEGTSNGVFGQGIAIHGIAKRTGMAASGRGVVGESVDSTGVYGKSDHDIGVFGQALDADTGVLGRTEGNGGQGVFGYAASGGVGVLAVSEGNDGLSGRTNAENHSGVFGYTEKASSFGGFFVNAGGGVALKADGLAQVKSLDILGGSDVAEFFEVADGNGQPGMVMVIDSERPGKLKVASVPYDAHVAGVISGAGGIHTGMVLSQPGAMTQGDHKVALTGRVYCWCDAAFGPIEVGSMLTTSATPGHAMKATDRDKAFGAVIGKAMTELKTGKGLVLALVSLQ